jgi:hypothetical protein
MGLLAALAVGGISEARDTTQEFGLHPERLPLVALGPVAGRTGHSITVLGTEFAVEGTQDSIPMLGDYVLVERSLLEQSTGVAHYNVTVLEQRYVPGASNVAVVFTERLQPDLKGEVATHGVSIDINAVSNGIDSLEGCSRANCVVGVVGTQPHPSGPILAEFLSADSDDCLAHFSSVNGCLFDFDLFVANLIFSVVVDETSGQSVLAPPHAGGSLGTGKASGSLGTGKASGSLGTGKASGSLGTGKASGSLGTGKASGSLGTGKASGSLGTGKAASRLGLEGSVG